MRILITGFEPFRGSDTNITQEIISQLPAQIGNREIVTICLPVSFQRAPVALQQAIAQHQPDMILLLGQCPASESIRLERFAMNMMDAKNPDNDGYTPSEETIYLKAPLAYRTHINIRYIADCCVKENLPVVISNSAGLYVCNRVYYEALYLGYNALFVHIPTNFCKHQAGDIVMSIVERCS